jgi:hypothetical protein
MIKPQAEAKDFRIGNYCLDPNYKTIIIKQLSMGSNPEYISFNGWNPYEYDPMPIPLDEEWLLKFGFEQMSSYSAMDGFHRVTNHEIDGMSQYFTMFKGSQYDRNVPDRFYIEPFEIINDNKVFIEHVHQLQNLYFALTGEELTIKTKENDN